MMPKSVESNTKWEIIAQSQIEQAERTARIEENQIRSDTKIDRLVAGMSELTNALTEYSSELRHTSKDVDETNIDVKELTSRVTILEIKGQERDTKIRMMIGTSAAAISGVIAWIVSKYGGS